MSVDYSEYPKTLAHPAFEKAKSLPIPGTEIKDGQGNIVSQSYQGTPEHFPPVTVTDPTQEEYYKAQGYQDAGKADPAAWVKAHSSTVPETYVPQEYPKWVGGKLVNSAEEEAELTGGNPFERAAYAEVRASETIEDLEVRLAAMKAQQPQLSRSEKAKQAWAKRKAEQAA